MGLLLTLKAKIEELENKVKILESKLNKVRMNVDVIKTEPKKLPDKRLFVTRQPYGVDAKGKEPGITDIDIEGTDLVQYEIDEYGNKTIKKDSNGNEMKSVLKHEDNLNKINVVWDKDAQCWRFYAVYAEDTEE